MHTVEPAAFIKVSALGVEEQRVRVLIDITKPQAEWQALGDGYRVSVRVRIVTLAETKVVQVPVSAAYPLPADGAGNAEAGPVIAARFAVFATDGGRNGSDAWIRSGVAPGQTVIVYPPATVRDGVRVAARKV